MGARVLPQHLCTETTSEAANPCSNAPGEAGLRPGSNDTGPRLHDTRPLHDQTDVHRSTTQVMFSVLLAEWFKEKA